MQSFEKQHNLIESKVENSKIHSINETPDETFQRLQQGLQDRTLTHKEIVDSIFNVVSLNIYQNGKRYDVILSGNKFIF